MGNSEDYDAATTTGLTGDQARKDSTSELATQIARREKQANDQRSILFFYTLCVVTLTIGVVVGAIALLGFGEIDLDTPVAVAFLSAMAVQSFVLIGLLARGLFMDHRRPQPSGEVQ